MKFRFTKRTTRVLLQENGAATASSRIPNENGASFIEVQVERLLQVFNFLFNTGYFFFPQLELETIQGKKIKYMPHDARKKPSTFNMKRAFLAFIIFFSAQVSAQKAPSVITTVNQSPAKKSATVSGYGLNPEYPATSLFYLKFGNQNTTADGVNNVIKSFVVDGLTYKPIPRPAVTPYDTVILKRKVNPKVADLGKFSAFYQNNGNVLAPTTKPIASGTSLYYLPEYVNSMESLINSYIVNRGTDNLFANANGATLNNIERVDLILANGVTAADVVKTGFLLMERGGNDPYKIAAITSLTPSGEVASLGPLVNGPTTAWGSTGITITSTVFQRNTGDAEIRPNQNIEAQVIKGSYVSFQSLGIPARTTIYGIALFPDDITSATDLLNLTNVPLNTGAASGLGGLDFMAGGGFFVEEHQELAFSLSGNIFDDGNGLTNALIDGNGLGNPGGSQLYAYLTGEDNLVKAKDTVTLSGTFVFDNRLMGNTNYTVVISTENVEVNNPAPDGASLPADWVITGDSYGNANLVAEGIQPGTPDLRIPVKAVNASITNVNFGIEQLPVAGNGTVSLPNPGGTNSAIVPANTFTNITPGSDPDGFIRSILVFFPETNANTLTIDDVVYTATQFTAAFPLGYLMATNAIGSPLNIIKADPISDDNTTIVIPYITIDNANIKSANKGKATIIFSHVNQVPIAVNDVNTTNEDTPVNGTVIGNDTPSGDGGNTWTLVGSNGGAAHGTVTMNTDGSYTYTPAANYNGTDVFNYKLCDVDNDCSSATVTITIVPVNDLPVAVNDVNATNEDTPVSGTVTGNDTPSGDGGNTWTLVGSNGGAAHGTVTMNTDGAYTYTPAANYNGTDVFNYKLCDVDNDCSSATVTITIVPVNDLPVAVNDVNATNEDTPVSGTVTGNDTPSGDGGNTWTLVGSNGGAAHGTVTMNTDGSYTYKPAANYNGTDVFNYKLCDIDNDCSSATVTITIVPVNDLPIAVNDVNATNEDTPVSGTVTGNDTPSGDGGNTWTLVGSNGGAAHGTVTMNTDGSYTYTPAANYNGTDVFNYKLCDVDNDCSSATVTITIVPVNDLPIAVNDVNATNEDTPVSGTVTGNDTPSGDGGNTWTLVGSNGGAAHGIVTMNPDGAYTYTPAANYNGTDVFNYKLCDVDNDCSSATVTIMIVPVNDLPIAVNDVNATNEDTPVNGTVTGNDTPSGDGGNTWTLVGSNGGAAHGIVTMNPDGAYTYTPAANYNGTDVFNYKLCDVDNDCSSATVTITIVPVNDLPIAVNDVNATNEDTPVSGIVTGNDTPSGDGGNTWTLVGSNGGAAHGTVTMNTDGAYTYTPAANYNGTDVFNYKLCDVDNDCSSATVTITIVPVNDLPVAVNDVNATNEDTPVSGTVTGNDTPSGDGGNTWTLVGSNGGAAHGTVTMNTDGSYTYKPAANYNGTDVFNYKLCDVDNDCSSATVTIMIVPVNDLPIAVNDVNATNEDTPVSGTVTGNDTPSGDGGNTWTLVGSNGGAAHGTVTMNTDGSYTYKPAANYNGTDVFNYKLCDIDNDCSSATVTITIVPVNDLPVAVNDVNATTVNTPVSSIVTGNDMPSADGGNLWTLTGINGGATHGTVTMSATGTYTYTPATNYSGTDVFNYRLCDIDNDCSSASVTITIAPAVTFCGCTPLPTDILINGSFENGISGWSSSGGNLTYGTGYAVCGTKNAFLQRTSGTAKIWQDVTGIAVGSTITLKAWAGTHTAGISCSPKLILGFYNSAGTLINATAATVDKDVDKPDYKLKEYTLTSIVPAGTIKVRVEGDIDCNWLKLDALCLTVTGGPSNTSVIGNLVWNDLNNNAKQDLGEPGISGASVKLTYPGGSTVVKTTDNNGLYSFASLAAGIYKISFTTPSGFVAAAANQGNNDDIDSDPSNGDVAVVLAAAQTNNTIDAGFRLVVCTNTTQHTETYPNQYNTGFATSLNNKTFTGSAGTWTLNSNSNATIVVVKPYYAASTSYALKIVNFNTNKTGAGYCSATSPQLNLTGACCPEKLNMTFTLWTYACANGDNNASLRLDFSSNNGSTWTEIGSATSGQLFSAYGANGKIVITVAVPLSYQNANFKYRFRGEMAAGNPNNFYLFIDDISITSPATCTSTTASRSSIALNTLPVTPVVLKDELAVKVLSNPTTSMFQLNINSGAADAITLRITDVFGRTLKVINHVQPFVTLNVGEDLKPGSYFVEVKQNTTTKVLKLVKL